MTAAELIDAARATAVRLACAESCTGGLLAAAITAVPGSSDAFDRGFVTYSNAAKREMLGVREATLAAHGAVSEEVAREMAAGARARSGGALAVAITGVAGPGGSERKPEGRVCFAVASGAGLRTATMEFGAIGRDAVRAASVEHALALLGAALRPGQAGARDCHKGRSTVRCGACWWFAAKRHSRDGRGRRGPVQPSAKQRCRAAVGRKRASEYQEASREKYDSLPFAATVWGEQGVGAFLCPVETPIYRV